MHTPKALLAALAWALVWSGAPSGAARRSVDTFGVPASFQTLTASHEEFVDVYFGGRKIGESRVEARPGFLRLEKPVEVLALVPNIVQSPELISVISGELVTNTERVCGEAPRDGCGSLQPQTAGIIFDEDHFRVDLFVSPKWLKVIGSDHDVYLGNPKSGLSLTNSMGAALSGSGQSSPQYSVQNRTILGFHNARIRADTSIASRQGLIADSLVAEVDEPGMRYSGGLFWAPGLDLIGQRRIVGLGVGSQTDTRTDRDSISGTPLIVFLSQPSRVDVMVDGRLLSSHLYEAGNNVIDTAALPDGAYMVTLRVQERSGALRDEQRFFAKNPNITPLGQTALFAYAGVLANTRSHRPITISHDLFYEAGAAQRLTNSLALDVSIIGTQKNAFVEAGGWALTPRARLRVAALASPSGDLGALVQLASTQTGRLSFNFDLRKIWSHSGGPLIPVPSYVDSFDPRTTNADALEEGSYTQASANVGLRLNQTYLALVGSYRKTPRSRADYSVGPAFRWNTALGPRLQLAVQGDAELSRSTTAAYLGIRLFYSAGNFSVQATGGARITAEGDRTPVHSAGGVSAQYSFQRADQMNGSVAAGVDHDSGVTAAQASGLLYSRLGSIHAEVRKDLSGDKPSQYSVSIQTAAAVSRGGAILGGRHLDESAIVVSVTGDSVGAEFDVIVDDQPRGRVKSGAHLAIFLQPYRAYKIRLRPVNAASVWFDTATRSVTVYPGNVSNQRWVAERVQTVFGRAVRPDGSPVANAVVQARRGVGETNDSGYFQVDVTSGDELSFRGAGQTACKVRLEQLAKRNDYSGIGDVVCR